MLGKGEEDAIELECPECGAPVRTTAKEVEKGKVRCPNGHPVAAMGILGGPSGGAHGGLQ